LTRPRKVTVKYEDENGDLKEAYFDGMMSRIFQHEHDHMMGKVFVDGVSKMKLDRAYKKAEKEMDRLRKYQNAVKSKK
jgi:peptide deformylase